jgi:hypothetical protein
MTRGPSIFRQQDITKAKDGRIVIIPAAEGAQIGAGEENEWDRIS